MIFWPVQFHDWWYWWMLYATRHLFHCEPTYNIRDPNNSIFPCGLLTTDDGTSSLLKHLSSRLAISSGVCYDLPCSLPSCWQIMTNPSCWQMSCQISVYRVYECMNSPLVHLASSHLCLLENVSLQLQDTAQGPRSNLKDTALISCEFSTWSSEALCSALRLTWATTHRATKQRDLQSWGSHWRACTGWFPFCRLSFAKKPDR